METRARSYVFIFSEPLDVTNLPLLELISLLEQTWEPISVTISLVNSLERDLATSRQVILKLFSQTAVVKTLNELNVEDLAKMTQRASYIFSCGELIIAEPWQEITATKLEQEILNHCRRIKKRLPIHFYSQGTDGDFPDFMPGIAIDEGRYFIENAHFREEERRIQKRLEDTYALAPGESQPGEMVFVIRDISVDQEDGTGDRGLYEEEARTLYLIAYHSVLKSDNPVYLLDDDKPYWAGPYTTPPRLMGAMYNLGRVKKGEVVLDPFAGTGTSVLEGAKIGCSVWYGDKFERQGCKDNIELLLQPDRLLQCIAQIESMVKEAMPKVLNDLLSVATRVMRCGEDRYVDMGEAVDTLWYREVRLQRVDCRILYYLLRRWYSERIIKGRSDTQDAALKKWLLNLKRYAIVLGYSLRHDGLWVHSELKDELRTKLSAKEREELGVERDQLNTRRVGITVGDRRSFRCVVSDARRMANIRSESVDAIITDPPYGYATDSEEKELVELYEAFLLEGFRVLRNFGRIVLCCLHKVKTGKPITSRIQTWGVLETIDRIAKEQNIAFVRKSVLPISAPDGVGYWRSRHVLDRGIIYLEVVKKPKAETFLYERRVDIEERTDETEVIDRLLEEDLVAAQNLCAKAKAEEPGNIGLVLRLARIYLRRRLFAEALKEVEEASVIDAANAEVPYHKGLIYSEMGMRQNAVECLRKALELKEDHFEAGLNLGFLLWGMRDLNGAIDVTNQMRGKYLSRYPDKSGKHFVSLTNNLCYFLAERGEPQGLTEAIELAGEIEREPELHKVFPEDPLAVARTLHTAGVAYWRGAVCESLGPKDSLNWIEKADLLVGRAYQLCPQYEVFGRDLTGIKDSRRTLVNSISPSRGPS